MPDFEQIVEYFDVISRQEIPRQKFQRDAGLAVAASGVISDLNWRIYADHLAGLKKRFEDIQIGQEKALLGSEILTHEQYAQLKSDQSYAKGYVKAITDAIDMIKTLVDNNKTQE